jgi:hypothetical protein
MDRKRAEHLAHLPLALVAIIVDCDPPDDHARDGAASFRVCVP